MCFGKRGVESSKVAFAYMSSNCSFAPTGPNW